MAAAWEQSWNGKTWQDMPGALNDDKKMNFFLFRRGILTLDDVERDESGRSGLQRKFHHVPGLKTGGRKNSLAAQARREAKEDGEWQARPPTITGLSEERRKDEGGRRKDEEPEPETSNNHHHHIEMIPSMKGRKRNPITERQLRLRERFMELEAQVGHGFGIRFAEHCNYKTRSNFRHLVQGTRGIGEAVLDVIAKGLDSFPKAEGGGRKDEDVRSQKSEVRRMPLFGDATFKFNGETFELVSQEPTDVEGMKGPAESLPPSALRLLTEACLRLKAAEAEVLRLALACAAEQASHT